MPFSSRRVLAIALLAQVVPAPALAASEPQNGPRPTSDPAAVPDADAPDGAFDLSASAALVSDYRFRGYSLSSNDPAIQAGFEAVTAPGVYGGLWASSVAQSQGGDAEADAYLGLRRDLAGLSLDIGAIGYFYPGGTNANSFELYGSVAREVGPASVRGGLSYTPQQDNVGETDGLYVFVETEAGVPHTPFTVRAHVGRETGPNGGWGRPKVDWLLGVDAGFGAITGSLAYTDTDVPRIDGGDAYAAALVASLAVEF